MSIFNKASNRYVKLKTAIDKGILDHPEKFIIPDNYFLRKDQPKLINKKTAERLLLNNKINLNNLISNKKLIYNPLSKKFNQTTKANIEKITKINKERNYFMNDVNSRFRNKEKFELKFGNKEISDADLLKLITSRNEPYTVRIGNNYYALNDNTRNRLSKLIQKDMIIVEEETKSDGEIITSIRKQSNIEFIPYEKKHKNNKDNGAFFKYVNLTDIDLTRYGIYKQIDNQNYNDTCLIYALKNALVSDEILERLKFKVKDRKIPKSDLEEIANIIQRKIILKTDDVKNHNDKRNIFGKQYEEIINIGLLDEHYFLIEETNYTSYSLNNYWDLYEEKDFNYIIAKRQNSFERNKNRCIDSYALIKILLQNKNELIEEINTNDLSKIGSTPFYDKINSEILNLEYNEEESLKEIIQKEEKEERFEFKNIFFDFETYLNDNNEHVPYLCRTYDGEEEKEFIGDKCGLYMLCSLKSHTRLIAHNATYDYRFIINYLQNINELSRGTRLISASGRFRKYKIHVKDSYHLITMSLKDFSKVFKLDMIKEIMPYDLYKKETIEKRYISIDFVLENFIEDEDKDQFLNNIKKWNLRDIDDNYDIIKYSSLYCSLDCKVLYNGYNTFKKWMLESTNINIDKVLTIASLSHQYFINKGCYEGIYSLSGIPQIFIQGCVVGGRTMTANNEKIIKNEIINDFDAVSLYPSAMYRIDGFLKGKPKVIKNLNYDWLKNQDGYFIDIKILKVGIKRDFSLMSIKNEEGVRIFNNDMENKILRVDKIALEDLIEFQKVEFEIIRGYYFDEGFNAKIKETIKFLFDERLRYKKLKNNIELVYKLIMNSGYGKSIMKPVETEAKFFDDEKEFDVYYSRNYNWISSYVKFENKIKVNKLKTINDHSNIAHVGVNILSMSKRIMNEVMATAEDSDIELFYQDTDSIHIKDSDIKTLQDIYNKKYNRELIGKSLGQFHSDFDLKDCDDVKAVRSVFLGKKCYIDALEGINSKGEKVEGYHIRMKGIPNKVIEYTSKKLNYKNVFDMYLDLYNGIEISFDLTNDGSKANFKFNKDYTINTLSIFTRNISF
jgi:hypothetical protein